MTLDDAIEYYSKIAESLRNQVRIEDNDYMDKVDEVYMCERLAEWLNELKLLRERIDAQPEQRWIPCTPDTMPSENDAYIVTCVGEGTKWTDVAEYSKRHRGWRYGLYSDNIIAWMPLPEPYGGEQE